MLSRKTQTYLAWVGVVGTLISCFGCTLAFRNEMNAARAFLLLAWIILVPLFFYLIIIRSRASAEYKRRLRKQAAQKQRELEALATVEGILKAGSQEPEARDQASEAADDRGNGPQPSAS